MNRQHLSGERIIHARRRQSDAVDVVSIEIIHLHAPHELGLEAETVRREKAAFDDLQRFALFRRGDRRKRRARAACVVAQRAHPPDVLRDRRR